MAPQTLERGVVKLGRKSYAVGLIWRAFDAVDENPRALAAAEVKEVGGDLYVANQTESLLIGLGNSKVGHKPGMPVLAIALLSNFSGATLGAFECDGGIYLIAFRDDQIVSGIEGWVADHKRARAMFSELMERTSWAKVFAPADWSVPDRDERTLEDLLSDAPSGGGLRPIARTRELLAAMGVAVLLVAAGGWWWQSEQERLQEFLLAQQRLLSAEQAAREERIRAAQTQQFPAPSWAGRMPASIALRMCFAAMSSLPVTVPGWNAVRGECQDGTLTVAYRRGDGAVQMFEALLAGLPSAPSLSHRGNEARVTWRLAQGQGVPVYAASEPTQTVSSARGTLVSRLESNQVFTYSEQLERGASVRILSADGTPIEAPLEQALRMVVTFSGERRVGIETLSDGLVSTVRSLSLDFGNFMWRLELDAHERLGVPGLSVPGVPRPASPAASPRRTS